MSVGWLQEACPSGIRRCGVRTPAVGSDSRHSKVHDQEVRDILPNPWDIGLKTEWGWSHWTLVTWTIGYEPVTSFKNLQSVGWEQTTDWLANKVIKLQKNKSIEMVNRILSIGVGRSTLSVLMILLICFFSWTLGYSLLFYFMLHYLIVHIFGLWLLCHFKNHKKMKNLRLGESIDNM